jgi:dimethylaniline monooxygenase (N-oxide forming)
MEPMRKRVAVIGAGPVGLAAAKELRECNHDVTVYESAGGIGGVFKSELTHFHLTISNHLMAFSDFPPSDGVVKYWSLAEYQDYLLKYCEHFGLHECIRLNTAVVSAGLSKDGKWEISLQRFDPDTKEVADEHEVFDALVVATGATVFYSIDTC